MRSVALAVLAAALTTGCTFAPVAMQQASGESVTIASEPIDPGKLRIHRVGERDYSTTCVVSVYRTKDGMAVTEIFAVRHHELLYEWKSVVHQTGVIKVNTQVLGEQVSALPLRPAHGVFDFYCSERVPRRLHPATEEAVKILRRSK